MKGLQQVEPVINNSVAMQFQEQSGASSKSGSRDGVVQSSQSSPVRLARQDQHQSSVSPGSFQKMLDQSNPHPKNNSAAVNLATGLKDMKQSKLFQKFLQKQQPGPPGAANNLKTSAGAPADRRQNLEASVS